MRTADPLPPSAVGKIMSALAGKPASRSIWNSRVEDDYDASAIGCLGWLFTRNALSATASELILSIARSSSFSRVAWESPRRFCLLKFGAPCGHTSAKCVAFDGRIKALHEPRGGAARKFRNVEYDQLLQRFKKQYMPTVEANAFDLP